MSKIDICVASSEDYKTVQKISKETFYETFSESNSEEDMQTYLEESFSDNKIKQQLLNNGSFFFIAYDENVPIGYLKINLDTAQTELRDPTSLEIERIYVKAIYHGQKVGQLLYNKAFEIAQQKGKKSIWLGVWEKNPRAIRFYEKNGFTEFDTHIFTLGHEQQIDIMMRKML